MSHTGSIRLGERLVKLGLVSREAVEAAAEDAVKRHLRLGEVLIDQGLVDQALVYKELAAQRKMVLATAEELLSVADPSLSSQLPAKFLEHHRILPISRDGKKRVVVATCDPDAHIPELAEALDVQHLIVRLVTPIDFRRIRMALHLRQLGVAHPVTSSSQTRELGTDDQLDATLVALFEALLLDAVAERASDIHVERYGPQVRIRLRIDGDLQDVRHLTISPDQHIGLVNVIKVSAELDIAERRVPQGGRLAIAVAGRKFDLRVQTQPSLHGEHVVIRLLPQDTKLLAIEDLGFSERLAKQYRRLLDSPAGLILVVGPTGSGKSTTLYAGLQVLARDPTRKVITVEDPIEYAIEGVQQTTARPELGFAFANAMRAFVREDPDVILVGEIRDSETALEALRASQTGHLVFSTLHCNDTVDAIQRLIDLGMHANSIASELLAVFAQRLAKRVCDRCRRAAPVSDELAHEVFGGPAPEGFQAFRGAGCPRCSGLGTRGRIGVVELLPANPSVRTGIAKRLPIDELRHVALEAGLEPMREQALDLVEAGIIGFDELRSLLPPERLAAERPRPRGAARRK